MKRARDEVKPGSNWQAFRKRQRGNNGQALISAAASFAAEGAHAGPAAADVVAPARGAHKVPAAQAAAISKPAADTPQEDARSTLVGPWEDVTVTGHGKDFLALDCEMVGVGQGGVRSALAQVVITDWHGRCIYNSYVRPGETVTDFRTTVSGILPKHVGSARPFGVVQKEVADLIRGKILVGHALRNDLKALLLTHPWTHTRDTATYRPFCRPTHDGRIKPRRLAHLVQEHLHIAIQGGSHDPAEDARAALALYKFKRREWERSLLQTGKKASSKS